jgi:molybdate transport system regulatory protein
MSPPAARLRIRIVFDDGAILGPGKADLLEAIAQTGSIAAAGRAMGMSYKRAWDLIATLNTMFTDPLVTRSRGGAGGGRAALTPLGADVLRQYRDLQRSAAAQADRPLQKLARLRKPTA